MKQISNNLFILNTKGCINTINKNKIMLILTNNNSNYHDSSLTTNNNNNNN